MTSKWLSALLFFCLLSVVAHAQVYPIYTDLHILAAKNSDSKNFEKYDIGDYLFYNGTGKEALYCYMLNKESGDLIFSLDEKDSKARRYTIRFFGDESNLESSERIITISLEGDYSWGSHILIVENAKVYNAGYLQYGIDDFNFASLGLHAQFEKHDDWYLMFFQEDAKLINYATEELIKGSEIEFKVSKTKIERTK
jgi:hypothetical protein